MMAHSEGVGGLLNLRKSSGRSSSRRAAQISHGRVGAEA